MAVCTRLCIDLFLEPVDVYSYVVVL